MNAGNTLMKSMTNSKCPFCSLGADVDIVCETQICVAFYDKYPVSPGHTLIIPKRHVSSYFDLSPQERQDMDTMLQYVKQILDKQYHPDGYNIGINVNEAAGQTVFHVHMHLIPATMAMSPTPKAVSVV